MSIYVDFGFKIIGKFSMIKKKNFKKFLPPYTIFVDHVGENKLFLGWP